jgi:hypothetical protein
LRGADAAYDPGTSIRVGGAAEPGLLGARCALGGGRAVGGSTLVDSALWGTGGPREWRDFAKTCARAGPKQHGAREWSKRLAAAASVALMRTEAYDGPCDAPIGGAPSSSSAATGAGLDSGGRQSGCRRRPWDPGRAPVRPPQFYGRGDEALFAAGDNNVEDVDGAYDGWDTGDQDIQGQGDDVPDCPTRGTCGCVAVHALPPAWDALSQSLVHAAGQVYGVGEVADHNGPIEFGVARRVQFAVGFGPPHGFNRQPAGDAFVGHATEHDRCASCRRPRQLTVVGGALVERVVFEMPSAVPPPSSSSLQGGLPRALGVVYLERGIKAVRAHARRRVILCASALTPALLQRSGIGDPRLIAGIGTRLVFANGAVGTAYHCPYGFRMVASVVADPGAQREARSYAPDMRSDLNPPGTVGIILAQDSTRPSRRRRQWCVLAAAGALPDYWPVAGDPLVRAASRWEPFGVPVASEGDATGRPFAPGSTEDLGVGLAPTASVVTFSASLLDPTSRGGGIETPSADPSVLPRARLGLYTDPADMTSMRALARSVARLIETMPTTVDGHRLVLAHPMPEVVADDALLDLWLRTEAFYVAHRHGGVCRVGAHPRGNGIGGDPDAGVVDGLLRVHGVAGLSVCDSTVFDHGMGPGTTAGTAAILATTYADMLLDGIVADWDSTEPLGGRCHQDRSQQQRRRHGHRENGTAPHRAQCPAPADCGRERDRLWRDDNGGEPRPREQRVPRRHCSPPLWRQTRLDPPVAPPLMHNGGDRQQRQQHKQRSRLLHKDRPPPAASIISAQEGRHRQQHSQQPQYQQQQQRHQRQREQQRPDQTMDRQGQERLALFRTVQDQTRPSQPMSLAPTRDLRQGGLRAVDRPAVPRGSRGRPEFLFVTAKADDQPERSMPSSPPPPRRRRPR